MGHILRQHSADHRQVHALFRQYADTPDPYLKQIIAEHIFAELTLYMLLEETVFSPAFAEQADEEGDGGPVVGGEKSLRDAQAHGRRLVRDQTMHAGQMLARADPSEDECRRRSPRR